MMKSRKKESRPGARTSLRTAVATVTLLLVSVVVALGAAEIVVRVIYGDKFAPRPGFYVGNQRLGWAPNALLDHTFYGPDFKIHIRTDSDGYRLGALGDIDYTKRLIILCGDSYAFGWGVSTDETFASHLDEMAYESSNERVRVVNLGVGGYGTFQTCDRLAAYLEAHGAVKVNAIVLAHSVNDAIDNLQNIGYALEMWETHDRVKSRSRWHLINLVAYLGEALDRGETSPEIADSLMTNRPYVQDLLWAYERVGRFIDSPTYIQFDRRRIDIPDIWSSDSPKLEDIIRNEELDETQRLLMLEALNRMHTIASQIGVRFFHAFNYTTPDWYINEVTTIIGLSNEETGTESTVLGRVPAIGSHEGKVGTGHSGGHYSAEFNRFWAKAVHDSLRTHRIPGMIE